MLQKSSTSLFRVLFLSLLISLCPLSSLEISKGTLSKIGERIWKNECKGSVEGLTSWNKSENFPSLGIAHFIWYPKGKEDRFEETFPSLLLFLEKEKVSIPEWLKNANGCPWKSRDEFYEKFQSKEMVSLRKLLLETKDLQASFIAGRLEKTILEISSIVTPSEKEKISTLFNKLSKTENGLYALIDYLNCKGSGILPSEAYNGKGWGLLQVLQGVPSSSENVLFDFVKSAKNVLRIRIENAPPEKNEEKWLKGWYNRLNTYLEPT